MFDGTDESGKITVHKTKQKKLTLSEHLSSLTKFFEQSI